MSHLPWVVAVSRVPTVRDQQLQHALRLGWFTIAYNLVEGAVAIGAGAAAGSSALIGFGLESGVESLSAAVLIWRLRVEQRDPERAEEVERRALRLIGATLLVLAVYVGVEAVRALLSSSQPESSPVGIALTGLSLIVMPIPSPPLGWSGSW